MNLLSQAIYKFNAIHIKIPMTLLHRTRTNNLKFCVETLKTPNSQNNLDKEEQSWGFYTLWFLTILLSDSNQKSMVLAHKQTHRSMKQTTEPRNKPTYLWSINLWPRRQEYTKEKRQSLSKLGKQDSYMSKNEIRTLSNIIYKNKLKMH